MRGSLQAGIGAAGLLSMLLTSDGYAADRAISPLPAPASWAGGYIGLHGGYGWDRGLFHSQYVSGGGGGANPLFLEGASGGGVLGGLQAGYDWQSGNTVVGVQSSLSWSQIEGEARPPISDPPLYHSRIHWLATLTARAGFASADSLYYVKAGAAVADVKVMTIVEGVPGSGRSTRAGWVAGGGFERRIAPNWTAAAEYDYLHFAENRHSFFFSPGGGDVHHTRAGPIHAVKFLLNYKPAQPATVADATPRSVIGAGNWSGLYVGAHAGYGWTSFGSANDFGTTAIDANGALAGVQAGYLRRIAPNWFAGFEFDVSGSGMEGHGSMPRGGGGDDIVTRFGVSYFGTARARLGYAYGPALLYFTGGAAWMRGAYADESHFTQRDYLGWTLGGGVDYAFAPDWSARVEYLHADFGSDSSTSAAFPWRHDVELDLVRFALNYHFGAAPRPAAAMPVKASAPAAAGWTGAYAGLHAGYGFGRETTLTAGNPPFETSPSGVLGGIQSGYNWQFAPQSLFGIEADVSLARLSDSDTTSAGNLKADFKRLGTARLRLGHIAGDTLWYGTAGAAWAHGDLRGSDGSPIVCECNRFGWTAGGGIEHAFAPNWTAKVEYLYADFGTASHRLDSADLLTGKFDLHLVRFGFNYRFTGSN